MLLFYRTMNLAILIEKASISLTSLLSELEITTPSRHRALPTLQIHSPSSANVGALALFEALYLSTNVPLA
jgi:hypothetical protein